VLREPLFDHFVGNGYGENAILEGQGLGRGDQGLIDRLIEAFFQQREQPGPNIVQV